MNPPLFSLEGQTALVTGAGRGMGYARFLESTPEDWERFVRLNMYGLMNGCHAVLPGMIEQGYGRVIACSSSTPRRRRPTHPRSGPRRSMSWWPGWARLT